MKTKNSATESYLQWALNWGLQPFQLDANPTELTWPVLVRGSLNCVLFMHHLIVGIR